jgi:hypothetical protein
MDLSSIARGSVFIWFQYTFEDGSQKDKYIITLNCNIKNSNINTFKNNHIYAVLTTSKYKKHYENNSNNMIDVVIVNKDECRFFKEEKTVIDLKKIILKETENFEKAIQDNRLKFLGLLEPDIFKKIENEIEEAFTISSQDKDILLCRNFNSL